MASPAAQLNLVASAVMASSPPKPASTEAACEEVLQGCKADGKDEKYVNALQEWWSTWTKNKTLAERLPAFKAVLVNRVEVLKLALAGVAWKIEPESARRGYARFCSKQQRELTGELVANPGVGATLWLDHLQQSAEAFLGSPVLLAWHSSVEKALLERLTAAAKVRAQKVRLSTSERAAAIARVRSMLTDHIALYVEHVNAGITDWHPTPEEYDSFLTLLSGGSAGTGAAGSLLTAFFAIGTGWFAFGIALTAAGGVLGGWSALRAQNAARTDADRRAAQERVSDALRLLGRGRADSLTQRLDLLAPVLMAEAIEGGLDVSGGTGAALSNFLWTHTFPGTPQTRVAAAQYFLQQFGAILSAARK